MMEPSGGSATIGRHSVWISVWKEGRKLCALHGSDDNMDSMMPTKNCRAIVPYRTILGSISKTSINIQDFHQYPIEILLHRGLHPTIHPIDSIIYHFMDLEVYVQGSPDSVVYGGKKECCEKKACQSCHIDFARIYAVKWVN